MQSSLILNIYAVQKRNFSAIGSAPTNDVQSIHRVKALNESISGRGNIGSVSDTDVANHLFI
ncbi:hypothetical protein KSF_023740 [Reticulibacter mediterranei]|uniref:Uncharacterized protein n=1 Tax=Reticulibacter mediterranei TaxID=2778369 RepID=A0A8J3ILE1_9CHLR|nr:hypothetical protein KSF_023740 [Reticulibacter mediterranei]